nr:hypothetical protein [Escherichia coli]
MKDDNSIDEKKPAPRLRRIGDIGINLFAPLAETRWMLRSCRHMLDQHKTRLKRLMPDRQPESPVCMTLKPRWSDGRARRPGFRILLPVEI